MKIIKPLIYYMLSLIIFFLLLFIVSFGSISKVLQLYKSLFVYFNILFATIYFYIYEDTNKIILGVMSFFALLCSLFILEIIYPTLLYKSVVFSKNTNKDSIQILNNNVEKNKDILPYSNLERAVYFFEEEEYISSYIYSDLVLDQNKKNTKALSIKNKSMSRLQNFRNSNSNPKYLETFKYKQLINQKKYIESYYFSLNLLNSSFYENDFLINLKNSYKILTKNYYSISKLQDILRMPGYSDIKFYYTKGKVKLYSIKKLVEYKNEYYIKELTIDNKLYPYIFIDKFGKVFSSGFNENSREVIVNETPLIPIKGKSLKLFSKELFNVLNSSLKLNIEIYNIQYVKYYKDSILSDYIFSKISCYSTIIIIFFMINYFKVNRNFINYFFNYTFTLLFLKWIIKKIGLLFHFYGLGLSIIIVMVLYVLWLAILIKKFKRSLFLS